MRRSRIRTIAAAAALSMAIGLAAPGFSLTGLAATGTVTATNVNVRSDATTQSSVVGSATSGETLQVGESKQDSTGATWYQVTLANGNHGYIRSDFITVTEDAPAETPEEQPAEAEAPAETPEEQPAEGTPAGTDSSSTSTGDYQIVLALDENGNETYYLYNNAAGERMKLSDIEALQTQVQKYQKEAKEAGNKYKVILIVLAVLLVLAIILAIAMFLRLRDALTNGRRERDLTRDRQEQRRTNQDADGLGQLRRREERAARSSRNGEAYPAGTRRPAQGESAASRQAARDTREGRAPEGYARRPQQAGERPVRETAERRPQEGAVRRPVSESEGAPVRREQARPAQAARPAQGTGRIPQGEGAAPQQQVRRQAAPQQAEGAARAPRTENAAPQQARRPQPKNFADEDFDFDFISMDEEKK